MPMVLNIMLSLALDRFLVQVTRTPWPGLSFLAFPQGTKSFSYPWDGGGQAAWRALSGGGEKSSVAEVSYNYSAEVQVLVAAYRTLNGLGVVYFEDGHSPYQPTTFLKAT